MAVRAGSGAWLTAKGSARATACPASLTDSGPPRQSFASALPTAGSLVHSALQLWLSRESWWAADPLTAVRVALQEVERASGARLTSLQAGGRAVQSLRSIATALVELLRAEQARSSDVAIEVPLVSPTERLWGVPDLVVDASRLMIIDFKSGQESIEGSEAARQQLLFYAHLLRSVTDRVADEVVVVSPGGTYRGGCDRAEMEVHVKRLRALRESAVRDAMPEPALCSFCPLRLECEPHWTALRTWEAPDALEGRVAALATALNGVRSVALRGDDGEEVVTVPRGVQLPELGLGDHVRFARVARDPSTGNWRAGRTSRAVRVP